MKFKFLKERWQRVTLRIAIGVIAFVLLAGFLINLYFSPILARTTKNLVISSSDSLYRVNFSDAKLHIFQRKMVIYNIDLAPDARIYNRLKQAGLAPNNLYRLHIKKLVLTYIHPVQIYFYNKLDIDNIILSAPELQVDYQQNRTKDTTADNRTLYQRISKTLRSVHVAHIGLNDVKFKYQNRSGNKAAVSELKEMNLNATDLLIDSASMTDKSRFLYCSDVSAELNNFSGTTLNGLYHYKMKQLRLSTRLARLNADSIVLQPVQPELFFKRTHADRFTVHIDSLQLDDFDFLSFHKYRKLSASRLTLSYGTLAIYSNPRPPLATDTVDRSATFPNAGIFKLKTDLFIPVTLLKHINIVYTELNVKSKKTGTAFFNNSNGRILNLATNAAALKKDHFCDAALSSYFMNKAKLDVNFRFDMTGKNLGYTYKGHVGPMNLNKLNPAIMPLAMLKINSGKLTGFDFNIRADKNASHGKVSVLYNDLKVTLLQPDTVKDKLKHLTIASLFANIFIIKHNNPDNAGALPRTFEVNYKRPPGSAFFKTVWQTLLTGIKSCAGYGEQKEKQVKGQMADRAAKKAERRQKRAERKLKREEKRRLRNQGE